MTTLPDSPGSSASIDSLKTYEKQLTEFYTDAAQLVWLIGNTQPFKRGSGTMAELVLNVIFRFKGLQPPLLKTVFPQLDVLDITFPRDDYIKGLFFDMCEPESLPAFLQKPSFAKLSAFEQINIFYDEINKLKLKNEESALEGKTAPDQAAVSLGSVSSTLYFQPPISSEEKKEALGSGLTFRLFD